MRDAIPTSAMLLLTVLTVWVIIQLQRAWPPGSSPFAPKVVHAAVPEPATLTQLDERSERRHRELLVRIESMRRQMLALHGKKYVKETPSGD